MIYLAPQIEPTNGYKLQYVTLMSSYMRFFRSKTKRFNLQFGNVSNIMMIQVYVELAIKLINGVSPIGNGRKYLLFRLCFT